MARTPVRLAAVVALALALGGCSLIPWPSTDEVQLDVAGSGSFDCGNGFHGCTAWLAIRPADWQMPDGWAPGRADRDFRPTPSAADRSLWHVSGAGTGGPETLAPGAYRFLAVITEADDTTPWVLGTDDAPGTGVLTLEGACESLVTVPPGSASIAAAVSFGPPCSIEVTPVLER